MKRLAAMNPYGVNKENQKGMTPTDGWTDHPVGILLSSPNANTLTPRTTTTATAPLREPPISHY